METNQQQLQVPAQAVIDAQSAEISRLMLENIQLKAIIQTLMAEHNKKPTEESQP